MALGARREPVRRADRPRTRARRGHEDRAARPASRRALRLRVDAADGGERRGAREGHARSRARADRARGARGRAGARARVALGCAGDGAPHRHRSLRGKRGRVPRRPRRRRMRASRSRAGSSATSCAPRDRRPTLVGSRSSSADVARFRARSRPCSRARCRLAGSELASRRTRRRARHVGSGGRLRGPDRDAARRSGRPKGAFIVEARDDTTALAALPWRSRPRGDHARASCRAPRRRVRGVDDPACRRLRRASSSASATGCPELGVVRLSAFAPFLSLQRARSGALGCVSSRASVAQATSRLGRFAAVTTMSRPELFASASAASARTMSAVASSFGSSSATPPENETTPILGSGRSRSAAWSRSKSASASRLSASERTHAEASASDPARQVARAGDVVEHPRHRREHARRRRDGRCAR